MTRSKSPLVPCVASFVCLFGIATTGCAQVLLAQPESQVTPQVAVVEDRATDTWLDLLEQARFADALLMLQQEAPAQGPTPGGAALIQNLQDLLEADTQRAEKRAAARAEALKEARAELDADHLELALTAAIRAQGLTLEPQALLDDPLLVELNARTRQAAREAEAGDDWIAAIGLYRLLDLLYEHDRRYAEDVARAARHVRVLQAYAPLELRRLLAQRDDRLRRERAASQPVEQPAADEVDADRWQDTLRDVELDMLKFSLRRVADRHVDPQDIKTITVSALQSVLTLVQTGGMEQELTELKNNVERRRYEAFLQREISRLQEARVAFDRFDAEKLFEETVARNHATLDLPESLIVFELAQGMTDALDDFSSVIWPSDLDQLKRSIDGTFVGVGIQIQRRDGKLTVVTPLMDTPAQRAGIRADDVIAQVDGVQAATWSLDKAVRTITGRRGTVVTLGIERPGEPKLLQLPIVRDKIEVDPVKGWMLKRDGQWSYWIDASAGIGYVRLSQFIPQSGELLSDAIAQMQNQGDLNALILDLRFNPGGLLSSAIDITDLFLPEGKIVATVNRDGQTSRPHQARLRGTLPASLHVVVLINRGSASASEIVAGALQHHGRALIVGDRSYGKGSVQNLYPIATRVRLDDKGQPRNNALGLPLREASAYLKLTTEYYMIGGDRIIHRKKHQTPDDPAWGITPDIAIAMTEDEVADALEARQALDILRLGPASTQPLDAGREELVHRGLDPQLMAAWVLAQGQILAQSSDPHRGPQVRAQP